MNEFFNKYNSIDPKKVDKEKLRKSLKEKEKAVKNNEIVKK